MQTLVALGVLLAGLAQRPAFEEHLRAGVSTLERYCDDTDPKAAPDADWQAMASHFESAERASVSKTERKQIYTALATFYRCERARTGEKIVNNRKILDYLRRVFELDPTDANSALSYAEVVPGLQAKAAILRQSHSAHNVESPEVAFQLALYEVQLAPSAKWFADRIRTIDLASIPLNTVADAAGQLSDISGLWCGSPEELSKEYELNLRPQFKSNGLGTGPLTCLDRECRAIRAFFARFACHPNTGPTAPKAAPTKAPRGEM